jgi:hypothetical protein
MPLYTNTTLAVDQLNTKGAATIPTGATAPRTGVIQTYYDRRLLNYAKKHLVYANYGRSAASRVATARRSTSVVGIPSLRISTCMC